jgi:hypothetical protein
MTSFLPNETLFSRSRGPRCTLSVCKGACCRNGAWVDSLHVDKILGSAKKIREFLPPERHDALQWFDEEREDSDMPSGVATGTATVSDPEDASREMCVFLRPGDYFCALQLASEAQGLAYPGLKPMDCALYPLLRSEGELGLDLWSPEELAGADCQQEGSTAPIAGVFADELRLALGEEGYQLLCGRLQSSL